VNLALGNSATTQISTAMSSGANPKKIDPKEHAVDNDPAKVSCTDDKHAQPWWSVDIDSAETIGSVVITFPGDSAKRNCRQSRFLIISLNG